MKNYVLLVDIEKCTQCYNCVLACKDEHFGNDFPPISTGCQELGQKWIDLKIVERGAGEKIVVDCWPELCRHCKDPECVKASDAVYKRDDGIVIIDPQKAKGQKSLVDSCPYNSISWNAEKELPQKCTLCAHLIDVGEPAPRCVEACPNSTLHFGDLDDPDSEVSRIVREYPELSAQTDIVRYYNLPGKFIAGSVYSKYLDHDEVVEDAEVQLLVNGKPVTHTRTNGFGDFKFDKLPVDALYQIKLSKDGFEPLLIEVSTSDDVYLEEIILK